MHRRLLLLGMLRQQQMHTYRLNEFIDRLLHTCSDLKKSTAYFLLEKMAGEGYVAETPAREGNYPERKVYSLTPAGEAYFCALLRQNLAGFERVRYPGDVGLALMHELPAEERVALLSQRRDRLAAELEALRPVAHTGGALQLVIERNVALLEAELRWLERAMEQAPGVTGLRGAPGDAPERQMPDPDGCSLARGA